MEKIPAYKRRGVTLKKSGSKPESNSNRQATDSKVSRFSLKDGKNGPQLSDNNPWLNDNVD
jgi:cell division protein FtsZ